MSQTQPAPVAGAPPGIDPLVGQKLGDFIVESAVASGGMGIVYRARHPILGRAVAVKVLRPEFARDAEQEARFLLEAKAISAIHHRGIIDVHNFGHLADGRQYMVMEFLEGETLEEVMGRDAPLPAVRALPIIDEVLDALSAAHKVGVVHRDLKPSNVFITKESNGTRYAKLVDFGLAKQAPISADATQPFAKASLVAGTPEYISPEQARGLAATPRTDLYCLGVMTFEMLTGKLPFSAGTVGELLKLHVYEPAPRMSQFAGGIPAALDDLVAELLQKDPEQRPRSADLVRQELGRVLKQLKEESTRQVAVPQARVVPAAAPASEAEKLAAPTRPVSEQDRRAVATTDIVSRKDSAQVLAESERSRKAWLGVGLLALVVFGGVAVMLGARGGKARGELKPPPAVAAPAPVPQPEVAAVRPVALVPEVHVARPLEPEELAALPALKPKPAVEPGPEAVARPAVEVRKLECTPSAEWKDTTKKDLVDLGSTAAGKGDAVSASYDKEEAALSRAVNDASSTNDCAAVELKLARLKQSLGVTQAK